MDLDQTAPTGAVRSGSITGAVRSGSILFIYEASKIQWTTKNKHYVIMRFKG